MPDLPFELEFIRGDWFAFWRDERVRIIVAGTPAAPDPARLATLVPLVTAWADTKRAIEQFVRALEGHVPLDPPSRGGFDASTCGFHESLGYSALLVDDPDDPTVARVHFDTGYPDGYAMYRVTLTGGVPTGVDAFAT